MDFLLKNNMKFNTFEIYNEFGTKVFNALDESSIPPIEHINVMLKNSYKIKLDGKLLTKKEIKEFIE